MTSYFSSNEMSNYNFRGNQTRGRGHNSGGNRRDMRDAQRAYNHYNDTRQRQDWSYQPEDFDPNRVQNKQRMPTTRSQNFKNNNNKKQNQNQAKEKEPEQTVVPSASATPNRDEPLYDIGPHSSLLAAQDLYCQNFEYSGFIPLINETYEKMRGVDPRLHDRLPLSMFTHAMCVHLNLEILELARQSGQNVLNLRTDAREILPDYQALPQSVVDYISHISSVITQDGKEIKLNLPAAAIPLGPVNVNGIMQPSGSFGPIAADNHNSYECYISPLVTSRRVQASQENNADYLPLPEDMIPGNLVPNNNLLGFEPVDVLGAGANSRLQGIQFPNDDTLEGRYRVATLLQDRVYTVLAEMKDRFKIVEFRRNQNEKGLNILEKIQHKITSVNLLFVETSGPVNDAFVPLYSRNVAVHGFGAQGSASANQANIECFHRRRIQHGAHMARGFCCTTQQGQGPGGWNATLNNNFSMLGLYAPVLHADYPHLRESHFSSHASAGVRTTALSNFIERNYYIKK